MPPLDEVLDNYLPDNEYESEYEEVAPNQGVSRRFTWVVKEILSLTGKVYSKSFYVGGYLWRVIVSPNENGYLSVHLDVVDSEALPSGWSRFARFGLTLLDQVHNDNSIRNETQHHFNARASHWGFDKFVSFAELHDPDRGYVHKNTCVVEVDVLVKEFGYVGLEDQGYTSYLNSTIQTLYHIPSFRKAVCNMPAAENDLPSGSISLALQCLFYQMQHSGDSFIKTKNLTKSFGWEEHDLLVLHDVQEFNRVLCENLKTKMKGTIAEGTIQQLFEGRLMIYLNCINVGHNPTWEESFYDIELDVKGCRNVYDSLDKYVAVKWLEYGNKYPTEQYGLQEAQMNKLFINFPPVLQLQLNLFEYDYMSDIMVKVNDHYEFPFILDLDRGNGKYLSPEADRSVPNIYTLHSVVVRDGMGCYYVYIRPDLSNQWFKFDNRKVTKEDAKKAFEERYGDEEELPHVFENFPFKFPKLSNACRLVYIREGDKDKIMFNVKEEEFSEHITAALRKEQEEKEKKRKETAAGYLYTTVKVAWDSHFKEHIEKHVFDLVDDEKVHSIRVPKGMSISHLKEMVAKASKIDVEAQRFWLWTRNKNHIFRPNRPLKLQEEAQTIGQLLNKTYGRELMFYVEKEVEQDSVPQPHKKNEEELLLFLKHYDPYDEKLRYVGKLNVPPTGRPSDFDTKLKEVAKLSTDERILIFKEIKSESEVMCQFIYKDYTFMQSQFENGDIIWYQTPLKDEKREQFHHRDVRSFMKYVHNRLTVHFRHLERPNEDHFCLELSMLHTYDDVVKKVAQHLGLNDPSKIRLASHFSTSQHPKPQYINYKGFGILSNLQFPYDQTLPILYYEVLNIPLREFECLRTVKVAFHHATRDRVVIYTTKVQGESIVEDVLNDLKSKVVLSHAEAKLRLLGLYDHKIHKIIPLQEQFENIDYHRLRAEEIAKEEIFGPDDRLVQACHFWKKVPEDTAQNQLNYLSIKNFGDPFFLVIHDGETLANIKLRIQIKLHITDEEFSEWKFAFLSTGHSEYLQDSEIVSTRFERRDDMYGIWEQYLGLEHTDNGPVKQVSGVYNDLFPTMLKNYHVRPLKIDN